MIKAPDVTLLYVLVAFIITYAILKKFLFVPLAAILEERDRVAKSAAEVHAKSLEEMQRAISEGEARLATARREALRVRETLRGEGRAQLERKLAGVREETTASIAAATREIEEQAARSAAELPGRARELARLLAEKVLGRKLAA